VRIELGQFRDDAVVLGASSLVVDEMLVNGGVIPTSVPRGRPTLLARPR
jgi:hypothetical protein